MHDQTTDAKETTLTAVPPTEIKSKLPNAHAV